MWLRSIGSTKYITYWSIDFCRLQIEYLRNISWNEEIVKFWPYSTILAPNVTFLYSLILLEICWPSFTLKTFSLFLFQFSWKALNRILHLRKPLTSNQSDDLHLAFFKELLLVEVSTPYSTWMFINYVRILLDVLYLDVFCSKMIQH